MASTLNHNPKCLNYCSKAPHDSVFRATLNVFSYRIFCFSICHPLHDDQIMYQLLDMLLILSLQPLSCFFYVEEEE